MKTFLSSLVEPPAPAAATPPPPSPTPVGQPLPVDEVGGSGGGGRKRRLSPDISQGPHGASRPSEAIGRPSEATLGADCFLVVFEPVLFFV